MNYHLVAIFGLTVSLGSAVHAAVVQPSSLVLSDFLVTPTSVSFSISGTIQGGVPNDNKNFLFLTTGLDGVDFVSSSGVTRPSILGGLTASVSGPSNSYYIEDGAGSDRISVGFLSSFSDPLTNGETISGSLTLTASGPILDPQAFADYGYAIHWGRDQASSSSSPFTGTYQGSGPIPEPGSALLLCFGLAGLTLKRARTGA